MRRADGARERQPIAGELIARAWFDGVKAIALREHRRRPPLQTFGLGHPGRAAMILNPVDAPFERAHDAIGGAVGQSPFPRMEEPREHQLSRTSLRIEGQ
jgi:hypothetical protein